MTLTKEECLNSVNELILNWGYEGLEEDLKPIYQLINEHFDNPPLSLNEVRQFWHEGVPVWDTELEEYVLIHDVIGNEENGLVSVEQFFFESISVYQYHSKRFYRKEITQ